VGSVGDACYEQGSSKRRHQLEIIILERKKERNTAMELKGKEKPEDIC